MKKIVFVNGRFLTQPVTGVQRYAREVLNAIDGQLGADSPLQWTVLAPPGADRISSWKHIGVRCVGRLSGHAWEQLELPLHAKDGYLLALSGAPSVLHRAQFFAIHDTALYDEPSGYSPSYRFFYRLLYRLSVHRAQAIFTVSQFSRERLQAIFGKSLGEVQVTYGGTDHFGRKRSNADSGGEHVNLPDRPYVLAVGSLAKNKNIELVLELAQLMRDVNLRFVLVGGALPKVFGENRSLPDTVQWLGRVSDDVLETLYKQAEAFIFPSLYEGFGLPPLEAMRFRCPVVASDAASIPEVCGDAALYFDPHSASDLKDRLTQVIGNPSLAEDLRKRGDEQAQKYKWEYVGSAVRSAVERIVQER